MAEASERGRSGEKPNIPQMDGLAARVAAQLGDRFASPADVARIVREQLEAHDRAVEQQAQVSKKTPEKTRGTVFAEKVTSRAFDLGDFIADHPLFTIGGAVLVVTGLYVFGRYVDYRWYTPPRPPKNRLMNLRNSVDSAAGLLDAGRRIGDSFSGRGRQADRFWNPKTGKVIEVDAQRFE